MENKELGECERATNEELHIDMFMSIFDIW